MYNIKINSWGRVITIAALLMLVFYLAVDSLVGYFDSKEPLAYLNS